MSTDDSIHLILPISLEVAVIFCDESRCWESPFAESMHRLDIAPGHTSNNLERANCQPGFERIFLGASWNVVCSFYDMKNLVEGRHVIIYHSGHLLLTGTRNFLSGLEPITMIAESIPLALQISVLSPENIPNSLLALSNPALLRTIAAMMAARSLLSCTQHRSLQSDISASRIIFIQQVGDDDVNEQSDRLAKDRLKTLLSK